MDSIIVTSKFAELSELLTKVYEKVLTYEKWKRYALGIVVGTIGVLTIRKVLDYVRRKWYNYPPGPIGIPFLGTFAKFTDINYNLKCAQYYGPIHMTNFGFTNVVWINDFELLTKLYKKNEFIDREEMAGLTYFPIACNRRGFPKIRRSREWELRRKLVYSNVITKLNSTFITNIISQILEENVFEMVEGKHDNNNEYIWRVRKECNYIAFATIYSTIFGDSCPNIKDKLFNKYTDINNHLFEAIPYAFIAQYLVPSGYGQSIALKYIRWVEYLLKLHNIIEIWTKNYDNNNKDNSGKNSLHYESIKEILSDKSDNNNIYKKYITKDKAISDINVVFGAGMHTTATAMEQCILYLAKFGNSLQNNIYKEISQFIIKENNGKYNYNGILKNRNQLHNLGSFIYEVLRIHGFVFATLDRALIDKSEIIEVDIKDKNGTNNKKKYYLPKNCVIFGNVTSINRDKYLWQDLLKTGNINEFNPKRFIDLKTNKMLHGKGSPKSYLATFGSGKRNCVGQELALKELYLVMAILINNYIFKIPNIYNNTNNKYDIPIQFQDKNTPMLGVVAKKR